MNDDVAAEEEESINRLATVITTQYGQSKSEQYCVRQTSANALQEWQTYMPSKLIAISTSSASEKEIRVSEKAVTAMGHILALTVETPVHFHWSLTQWLHQSEIATNQMPILTRMASQTKNSSSNKRIIIDSALK